MKPISKRETKSIKTTYRYDKIIYKSLVMKSKSNENKEDDQYCGECAADDLHDPSKN